MSEPKKRVKVGPVSYDPWTIRINAPPPPDGLRHLLGPNDISDPLGACYREFDWVVDDTHVQYYFARGVLERKSLHRSVTPEGETFTIVNGRHWLIAARLAAKRRADEGLPELRVNAGVDVYDKELAALHAFVTNKKYKETPAQRGRDMRTYLRQTGKTHEEAAVAHGVTEQTIRAWLKRADDEDAGKPSPKIGKPKGAKNKTSLVSDWGIDNPTDTLAGIISRFEKVNAVKTAGHDDTIKQQALSIVLFVMGKATSEDLDCIPDWMKGVEI